MLFLRRALATAGASALLVLVAPGVANAEGEAAPPTPATAAPAATGIVGDTVFLRNGGTVRGTIHEIIPGDHVTVLGPGGEIWSVPWAQVDRVELGNRPRAGSVPAPPPAPLPAPVPVAASGSKPRRVGPTVRLHVESKRAVQLYRQPAQDGGWYEECTSPCDVDVPLNDEYRISGAGIFQSRDFRLEGAPGSRVVISVDPSSRSTFVIGGVLTALGGILDYIGLVAALSVAASDSYCYDSTYSSCSNDKGGGAAVATGLLLGGTAMMVTGIIVMIANSSSGVSQVDSGSSTASRPLDAYKREAVWRTPSVGATNAPALSLPIFTHSF